MTSTTTNTISKVAALAAAAAFVGVSLMVAPAAHAQTAPSTTTTTTTSSMSAAALQAQIASLQAQLAAAQGTSMSMSTTFSRSLTIGSTGSDVTALQNWLISKGYSIPAGATGYFGAQTKAALAAYQAANGISPAVGYFGPITMAKVNASGSTTTTTTTTTSSVAGCVAGAMYSSTTGQACGTTTTTTGSTGPLTGAEGSIDNFQVLGAPSNTSLYQGQTQQVYGFQFQADGSDMQVNRVDFDLTNTGVAVNGGTGQDRPWSVLQTATLYDGSTVIGTVDASNSNNWSQDGTIGSHQTYRIRFDNLTDVVKMGSQHDFYVAFTAQNGVSDANQTQYQVVLADQGVRATDAMGIQQYSGSNTNTSSLTNSDAQIFYVSNGTAGTVTFSTGSDNPQASTVMANQSSNTQNVVLNTFTIQSNSATTNIYDLPVYITVPESGINPVQDVKLYEGTTLVDSESVTAGMASSTIAAGTGTIGTTNGIPSVTFPVLFNNLTNLTIPAGTTQSFSIQADINPVGGTNTGNANEGAFVIATVNPNFNAVNNANGTDIEQGSNRVIATGASTGNVITFHVNGLSPDAVPTTSSTVALNGGSNTTQQKGTFTFTFNVTAFGEDVYVASTTTTNPSSYGSGYTVQLVDTSNGTRTVNASTTAITSNADISPTTGNYIIHSGQSKQITISATLSGGYGDFWQAILTQFNYSLNDTTTYPNHASLNTNYRTAPVAINS